jgi:hypothetical protein
VDRDRELVVTDDAVLRSLSTNGAGGPLSFRRAIEHLAPGGTSSDFTLAWLSGWSRRLRDEGQTARADVLDAQVTCPWLRRNPESACSPSCDACASKVLRLEDAPFRLIAVANRTDLSVMPDRAADGGEGRLVFALTDGAADVEDAMALPMTVIVEYAQQGTAKDWAARWHALGSVSDDAFVSSLTELAGLFVDAGSLAQIRTGDALTGPLVLHEFHLESGALAAKSVRNTPDWAAVSEPQVRAFCTENADALENGTQVLPAAWLASSSSLDAEPPAFLSTVTDHDALVHGTCGGCHRDAERGFQIDPLAHGTLKLSRFLVDPSKDRDEIGRRVAWMQLTLSNVTTAKPP